MTKEPQTVSIPDLKEMLKTAKGSRAKNIQMILDELTAEINEPEPTLEELKSLLTQPLSKQERNEVLRLIKVAEIDEETVDEVFIYNLGC